MDVFSALRFTVKGPNSIANSRNERNVSDRYRGTDVSYLGNIDINVYSSSSPGLNGSLTPFAHTNGLYFNDEPEPQDKAYQIEQDIEKLNEDKGYLTVKLGKENNSSSYYDTLLQCNKEYLNGFKLYHNNNGKIYIRIDDDDTHILI